MPDRMKMGNSITLNNNYSISKVAVFSNLGATLPHAGPWNPFDEPPWDSNTGVQVSTCI